jgi:hypothetical protein
MMNRAPFPASGPPRSKLSICGWKPLRRGTLRGFVSVRFGSGLILRDCPIHLHANGRCWVALPGKPLLDSEGRHRRAENGKLQYAAVAEWVDRATSDKFSEIVAGLLQAQHPSALDGRANDEPA